MKECRRFIFVLVFFSTLFVLKAWGNDYCSVPAFVERGVASNLLLVLDYSGSMSWYAYPDDYDPTVTYFGFFDPDARYSWSFVGSSGGGGPGGGGGGMGSGGGGGPGGGGGGPGGGGGKCWVKNPSGSYTGNYLNWYYMTRVDILRLVLTGGEQGTVCVNTYYTRIKTEDTVSYNSDTGKVEGILQKIERMTNKPRIGLFIYSGSSVIVDKIYPSFNYTDVIDAINSWDPSGGTPTGEALYDAMRYFSREDGVWGGFSTSDSSYVDPYTFVIDGETYTNLECVKNFVLLMTDGAWNGHYWSNFYPSSCGDSSYVVKYPADANYNYSCAIDPVIPVYDMWRGGKADLISDISGNQNVKTFTVAMFLGGAGYGKNSIKNTAIFGGFADKDNNTLPCNYSSLPSPQCSSTNYVCTTRGGSDCDNCGSFTSIASSCSEWDSNNDGLPDNYFEGDDPDGVKNAIENAFAAVMKEIFSGTSISVISEKARRGSVMSQALFYASKDFGDKTVDWVGYIYNWWLYSTKTFQNIREDTVSDKQLKLLEDYIIEWNQNYTSLLINVYNSTSYGEKDELVSTYTSFDSTHPVWESGAILSQFSYALRNIKTVSESGSLVDFNVLNKSEFDAYLGDTSSFPSCLQTGDPVSNLINYIRGSDISGCRSRTTDTGYVWKLGDIVHSTPRIVDYGNYSIMFVGANDGMLHAFYMGYIGRTDEEHVARVCDTPECSSQSLIGKEIWAFIPKNALPYLRFLADPNYCHVYFVDLSPYVIDIDYDNDGANEKVLIGGMRLGGACGCSSSDCVNPPSDTCPNPVSNCVGLSSYFALDVTDPLNPQFMWEFSDPYLGFSFSGPAVVKKSSANYVIFASGPTNYKGESAQYLKLYIVNLSDGSLVRTVNVFYDSITSSSGGSLIANAYGGRLFKEAFDYNLDGFSDYVFMGLAYEDAGVLKGGIIEGDIRDNDPANWKFAKYLTGLAGPVVGKVEVAKCFDKIYIYFGTGKYFYKTDNPPNIQRLYGVEIINCAGTGCEPYNSTLYSDLNDVCSQLDSGGGGWYLDLDGEAGDYLKERLISDPSALEYSNVVVFTTSQPTGNPCKSGGRSRVWMLNCATGGSLDSYCDGGEYKASEVSGNVFLQLSGGGIVSVSSSDLTQENGKATDWFNGMAPEVPPLYSPSAGKKSKIIFWIEK